MFGGWGWRPRQEARKLLDGLDRQREGWVQRQTGLAGERTPSLAFESLHRCERHQERVMNRRGRSPANPWCGSPSRAEKAAVPSSNKARQLGALCDRRGKKGCGLDLSGTAGRRQVWCSNPSTAPEASRVRARPGGRDSTQALEPPTEPGRACRPRCTDQDAPERKGRPPPCRLKVAHQPDTSSRAVLAHLLPSPGFRQKALL